MSNNMKYDISEKLMNKSNVNKMIISQYALICIGIAILLMLIPLVFIDITLFLIFFISACIILPFFIGIPFSILRKSVKIKKKFINGQYRVVHETLVDKNFTELGELSKYDRLSDEVANAERVYLQDDNGNIRETYARTTEFVDANIGDEFFTIYLEGEKEPYHILTKEQYYSA